LPQTSINESSKKMIFFRGAAPQRWCSCSGFRRDILHPRVQERFPENISELG